jgi:hypothetical protein
MISKYNKFLKEKQMRDILNLLDNLTEEKLAASQMPITKASGVVNPKTGNPYNRQELFLIKVKTGSPFTLVSGGEVVIDPKEAKAVELGRPILDEAGFKILLADGPDAAKAHLGLN